MRVGHLVKCHAIELDSFRVVFLSEVDVPHVDLQPTYKHIKEKILSDENVTVKKKAKPQLTKRKAKKVISPFRNKSKHKEFTPKPDTNGKYSLIHIVSKYKNIYSGTLLRPTVFRS